MFTFPTLCSFNKRVFSKMNIASQVSCYKGEQAEDLKAYMSGLWLVFSTKSLW
jgi:hypothetical protein